MPVEDLFPIEAPKVSLPRSPADDKAVCSATVRSTLVACQDSRFAGPQHSQSKPVFDITILEPRAREDYADLVKGEEVVARCSKISGTRPHRANETKAIMSSSYGSSRGVTRRRESESSAPPAKRFKSDYMDIIEVLVGIQEVQFRVHKALVCKKSPFFTSACSTTWKEGQDNVVRLPAAEPEVFQIYLHWVYTTTINLDLSDHESGSDTFWKPSNESAVPPSAHRRTKVLFKTYILADQLLDRPLKNAIIDLHLGMAGKKESVVGSASFALACTNTPPESGLYRCVIDTAAAILPLKSVPTLAQQVTKDVLVNLVSRQVEMRGVSPGDYVPSYERRCKYHEHDNSESCN